MATPVICGHCGFRITPRQGKDNFYGDGVPPVPVHYPKCWEEACDEARRKRDNEDAETYP